MEEESCMRIVDKTEIRNHHDDVWRKRVSWLDLRTSLILGSRVFLRCFSFRVFLLNYFFPCRHSRDYRQHAAAESLTSTLETNVLENVLSQFNPTVKDSCLELMCCIFFKTVFCLPSPDGKKKVRPNFGSGGEKKSKKKIHKWWIVRGE